MPEAIRCFKTGGPCTVDVQEKPRLVFVIMPFAEAFDDVYELGIKASVEAMGWECRRADEIIHNRDIMCQVCQGIRQARFVIADLTDQNVNVFYELGMAHALEKDVILLAQDVGDVPFDLRQMNIIEYVAITSLRQRLSETLLALFGRASPVKVFVSSTWFDLQREHQAVEEALRRLGPRFGFPMEYFGSQPDRPKKVCLELVARSDVYIGIFAHRYGEIDPETGLSMTELEYRKALDCKIPCYIYMKGKNVPVILDHIEHDPQKRTKLAALTEKLLNDHTVSFFTNPDNLATQVVADLYNLFR